MWCNVTTNVGMSCLGVRRAKAGGSVYVGSILGRFGNRKPPSAAYATPSPILHFVDEKANNNKTEILFIGGNFWDGRATGENLGNPAADQPPLGRLFFMKHADAVVWSCVNRPTGPACFLTVFLIRVAMDY